MNDQYVQWLKGPSRGSVETIHEMKQDGQTFEDVVVLSNGKTMSMSGIGKNFIILPSAGSALSPTELDLMYPPESQKQNRRAKPQQEHAQILGFSPDEPQPREEPKQKKQPQRSSFASDLISRAKKNPSSLDVSIEVEMPSSSFFSMINETFDESTVEEVMSIIIDGIDRDLIKQAIKESIINFYGDKK
jgi:hypothetical protein